MAPVASSRRAFHTVNERPANACIGRFAVDDVQYEFKAYFYYTVDETTVKVWDIKLTIQDRPDLG